MEVDMQDDGTKGEKATSFSSFHQYNEFHGEVQRALPGIDTVEQQASSGRSMWQVPTAHLPDKKYKKSVAMVFWLINQDIVLRWGCTPTFCLPAQLEKITPYSMAMVMLLREVSAHTSGDLAKAQGLLLEAWREGLEQRRLEEGAESVELVVTIRSEVDVTQQAHGERILKENKYGLMLFDVQKVVDWLQIHASSKDAAPEIKRAQNSVGLKHAPLDTGLPEEHPYYQANANREYHQPDVQTLPDGAALWQLPGPVDVTKKEVPFKKKGNTNVYHQACKTIYRKWKLLPSQFLIPPLHISTPYSLALLTRLQFFAGQVKDWHTAQAALVEQVRERLKLPPDVPYLGDGIAWRQTNPNEVIGQMHHTKVEYRIIENTRGLMLIDIGKASAKIIEAGQAGKDDKAVKAEQVVQKRRQVKEQAREDQKSSNKAMRDATKATLLDAELYGDRSTIANPSSSNGLMDTLDAMSDQAPALVTDPQAIAARKSTAAILGHVMLKSGRLNEREGQQQSRRQKKILTRATQAGSLHRGSLPSERFDFGGMPSLYDQEQQNKLQEGFVGLAIHGQQPMSKVEEAEEEQDGGVKIS